MSKLSIGSIPKRKGILGPETVAISEFGDQKPLPAHKKYI